MKKILETPRLYLRELCTDDAEHFYRLNLNPNVIRYTGNTAFASVAEAREFLENYDDYQKNGYGRWAVIEKASGTFVGWCGLKYDEATAETDIGFRFFEEHWNRGFATESALACIRYGFEQLGLTSIVGRAMRANAASVRVLEKAGLQHMGSFDFDAENKGVLLRITRSL